MSEESRGDDITAHVTDSSNVAVGKNITTGQTVNQTFTLPDNRIGAADLAAWATANNVALDGLLKATYDGATRAALQYLTGYTGEETYMPPPSDGNNYNYLERRLDRLEGKFDEQHVILQQIQLALGSQNRTPLNWNIIIMSLVAAAIIASLTYFAARIG